MKKHKQNALNVATNLRLDWCSHKAAKFAVEHWHYSKRMPVFKVLKIGVWENDMFIGCVIFGLGSCRHIGKQFGLEQTAICELVRVALKQHRSNVTKIIKIAIALLYRRCPGLKMIVSYADPEYGHVGTIYQAGNWL